VILQRLKRIEKHFQDKSVSEHNAFIFRNMSDEEFAKEHKKPLQRLNTKYGISTETELADYFREFYKWYKSGMGDEATIVIENYGKSLIRRKDRLKSVKHDRSN